MRPFIDFIKFSPELFRHPDISISLKLPDKTSPNICYKKFLKEANVWFQKMFLYIVNTEIEHAIAKETFADAMLASNLAKLFDDLGIRTWSVDNLPQPTDYETKADIVKCFLFALHKNCYIVHVVLKNYVIEEKQKNYIFLFQNFLEERDEEEYLEHYLTPEWDLETDEDGNYTAQAYFENIVGYGVETTKNSARQTACKLFLQQWATK